jgi:hypothetical protein
MVTFMLPPSVFRDEADDQFPSMSEVRLASVSTCLKTIRLSAKQSRRERAT